MSRQPLNHRQRIDRVHAVRVPASPFVQFFYPLNLPLALYYRVAGGYSVVDPTDRGGGNYAYSTEYEFTFSDTVGSLAFPPAAQAEGW